MSCLGVFCVFFMKPCSNTMQSVSQVAPDFPYVPPEKTHQRHPDRPRKLHILDILANHPAICRKQVFQPFPHRLPAGIRAIKTSREAFKRRCSAIGCSKTDALKRLITASGRNWSESYSYDGWSNLLQMSGNGNPAISLNVDATTNRIKPTGTTYSYDNNGNMSITPWLQYDVANRCQHGSLAGDGVWLRPGEPAHVPVCPGRHGRVHAGDDLLLRGGRQKAGHLHDRHDSTERPDDSADAAEHERVLRRAADCRRG